MNEKIDKFLRHENLSLFELVNDYYKNFVIYYANTFMPLALFIAVILIGFFITLPTWMWFYLSMKRKEIKKK